MVFQRISLSLSPLGLKAAIARQKPPIETSATRIKSKVPPALPKFLIAQRQLETHNFPKPFLITHISVIAHWDMEINALRSLDFNAASTDPETLRESDGCTDPH
ncbi:hypothetical protein BDZ91DRAFT_752970 [Kalaharituber pfeilii]|nr:hypothetical protein BDZ91DRAFT_752970 [Kalaharituber pfeilii]